MRAKLVIGTAVTMFLAACGTGGSSSSGGIEATSTSYLSADGIVVVSGDGGCVQSSAYSKNDTIGACEGEEEAVAKTAAQPAPQPVAKVSKPATVAKPSPAPAPKSEKVVLVGRTMFQFDSDLLSTEGSNEMRKLSAMLRAFKDVKKVEVVGHTDSNGSEAYNQALSERRAVTVKNWFESVIPGFPVVASGAGESTPLASNDTRDGRRLNRRVEITVDAIK